VAASTYLGLQLGFDRHRGRFCSLLFQIRKSSALVKRPQICFFGLPIEVLGIWGLLIYCWKVLENTSLTVYCPQNFKIPVVKEKRKICSPLVIADQDGQKNRNEQTIAVLFYHVFY